MISGLCEGGLLAEVRGASEPTYRFRHALIQDATYKSLMKDQRRRLHAKAAWALEDASWTGWTKQPPSSASTTP